MSSLYYSYLLKTVNCANIKIDWSKVNKCKMDVNDDTLFHCKTLYDFALFLNGKLLYGYFDDCYYYKIFNTISVVLEWPENINHASIFFDLDHQNLIWCLNIFRGSDWFIKSTKFEYDTTNDNFDETEYIKHMFNLINLPNIFKFDLNIKKLFL